MSDTYDENKPLYGSRGIAIYLKLLRTRYSHVNIDELLEYSEMKPYQVTDDGHLFSQKQINLFHEKIVELSSNKNIAREAGQFASSPEALGTLTGSVVGLLGPMRYYELIGKIANKASLSSHYEAHKIAHNKVEIVVTPFPGTIEQPFQCNNRLGYWDAVSAVFGLGQPTIEHPKCLFKGDDVCQYFVSWKESPAFILKKIRNTLSPVLILGCIASAFLFSTTAFAFATLATLSTILWFNWYSRKLEVRHLHQTVANLRGASDELVEQIQINYENSLLVNEIGQALAKESDNKGLFAEVMNLLQKRLDYDRGMVFLLNNRKTELVFQDGFGFSHDQLSILNKSAFSVQDSDPQEFFSSPMNDGSPVLLNDVPDSRDSIAEKSYEFLMQLQSKALITCPLMYEENVLGIMTLDNTTSKRNLMQRDINLLMGVASQIASRMHNMTLEIQLRQNQKMEAVGILAGGVAHDFNNVLTTILGYSELIATKLPENDPLKEKIEDIYHAGEKAAALTRQLLAFSRKQVLEMSVADLNTIVNDMGKMLNRLIGEDVVLDINTTESIGNVKADVGQLEQVLMNLAVNARDAMPCGGRLTIETGEIFLDEKYVEAHAKLEAGTFAMLTVTDTGEGMAQEVQQEIFEPFFTTKERGKGTGLGLSTVYGIIKQHHGHIYVYSEPGRGTTFKIYLPTVSDPVEKKDFQPTSSLSHGTETILVVDDDPSIRRLVFDTLEPLGYTMLEAACGEEALGICRSPDTSIDLLLTDVIMPGMNGRELSEIVTQEHPGIKSVLMSGYTDNVVAERGVLEPGILFINKPILPVSLAARLREVLDRN